MTTEALELPDVNTTQKTLASELAYYNQTAEKVRAIFGEVASTLNPIDDETSLKATLKDETLAVTITCFGRAYELRYQLVGVPTDQRGQVVLSEYVNDAWEVRGQVGIKNGMFQAVVNDLNRPYAFEANVLNRLVSLWLSQPQRGPE